MANTAAKWLSTIGAGVLLYFTASYACSKRTPEIRTILPQPLVEMTPDGRQVYYEVLGPNRSQKYWLEGPQITSMEQFDAAKLILRKYASDDSWLPFTETEYTDLEDIIQKAKLEAKQDEAKTKLTELRQRIIDYARR